MCFIGAPASDPSPPASDSQAAFPAPNLGQPAPPHLGGGAHTRISESVLRMCRGIWGPGLGISAPCAHGHRMAQKQRPFSERLPHFPLKHKPTHQADFGVSVYCKGFLLFGRFFWLFPSIWGMGWEGSACRARHLSFPKAYRAPHPLLQHMCTTCKVSPPSRKKEAPPASENGGGCRKRGWEYPPLQSKNPN